MSIASTEEENKTITNVFCDPSTLETGEWLSGTVYYKITGNNEVERKKVEDFYGNTLFVTNNVLAREMVSSVQFDTIEKVSRTEMVDKLMNAGDTVFTAKFKKKMTGDKLQSLLVDSKYSNDEPVAKRKRICNKALKEGDDRTLTGFLYKSEPLLGRSSVIDLNAPSSYRERLLDHRTLYELTLNRVKYVLK